MKMMASRLASRGHRRHEAAFRIRVTTGSNGL
jgi:hypothetical protein